MTSYFDSLATIKASDGVFTRPNPTRSLVVRSVSGAILAWSLLGAMVAEATTISFQQGVSGYTGTRDTYFAAGQGSDPDTNYGTATNLAVYERETSLNNYYRSLVGFNLSSVAPGTIVHGATLTLYQQSQSSPGSPVTNSLYVVAQADNGWTQSGATWNYQFGTTPWVGNTSPVHAPGTQPEDATNTGGLVASTDYNSSSVASAATPTTVNAPMNLVLDASGIAAIQDWINNPSDNSGFFLRQASGTFSVDGFWSSNVATASLRPLLTLDVTVVPEPSSYLLLALGAVGLWVTRQRHYTPAPATVAGGRGLRSTRSRGTVFLVGAVLALSLLGAAAVQAATISLQQGVGGYTGTRDTYIAAGGSGSDPDTNYGSATFLPLFEREPSSNNFFRSLVGFDVSSVAPGTIVNGATLTLYQDVSVDAPNVTNSLYVIAQADKGWTESGATWNNQTASTTWAGNTSPVHAPGAQPEDATNTGGLVPIVDYNSTAVATAATPTPSTANAAMTFTLDSAGIAAIQDWVNNPTDNSGFFIRQPTGSNSIDEFWSSRTSDNSLHPLLTLDVTPVPEPASYLLLLVGAAGLWVVRRRRK